MCLQSPAAVALQRMVDAFNSVDVADVREYVGIEYVDHQGLGGTEIRGPDGFSQVVVAARAGYVSLKVVTEDLFGERDRAVARLHWIARPAQGAIEERETMEIIRLADGKVVEHWGARSR